MKTRERNTNSGLVYGLFKSLVEPIKRKLIVYYL